MIHKRTGFKFKTKPWKHQLKALEYLMSLDQAALYTKPATGKTKVMIDLINNREFEKTLIVCPKKAMDVWEEEIPKHSYDTNICVLNLKELSNDKKVAEILKVRNITTKTRKKLIVIVNYDNIWRKNVKEALLKVNFQTIICDESHRIKSPSSKCSKALGQFGNKVKHRYLMTGTPLATSPLDIYAQYRFLNKSIFGTRYDDFKRRYGNFVSYGGIEYLDPKNPYKNLDELQEKMFSIAFMDESSVELPPEQDIIINFDLSAKTQKIYKEFKKESCYELQSGFVTAENALSMVLRFQQMTSGFLPVVDKDGRIAIEELDNSRITALGELLEDFDKSEPIVVFCRYRRDIDNVLAYCKKHKISVSEVSGKADELKEWKDGKTSILVCQIQAANESIDLTRSCYCIYYNLHPSLSMWTQSRARIRRPNQERPCIYYILQARAKDFQTIDQKMLQALYSNEKLIESIMKNKDI